VIWTGELEKSLLDKPYDPWLQMRPDEVHGCCFRKVQPCVGADDPLGRLQLMLYSTIRTVAMLQGN